ncbi:MAG: ferredoxin-type protein NapF [Arcobacteraceae bacterium]|jgi:ferredoxin-type protein NapF|nr:ferredoxin-type protein NapF [Arcobacteraceae bacterium]
MERRELFTFMFKKKEEPKKYIVRPPYFANEERFAVDCINCDGKCAVVCPEKIIIILEDKTPSLDFSLGGCTYCDECALICPSDALTLSEKKKIDMVVSIDTTKCMSWQNTMCFSCKDPCLDDAIFFDGIFKPTISSDKCTNCGFCIKVCPSDAIVYKQAVATKQ